MSAAQVELSPAPISPAAKLTGLFSALKKSRIRLHPVHTTRASSIGHDCKRFLFYERTSGELRLPHGEGLQAIFDLGNALERYVVAELGNMGIDVLERSRDYLDRELELSGHIDGKLAVPGFDHPVPAEIKGLNPYTAESIETIDDIRNSRQGWVRKYYGQLQSYLRLEKKLGGRGWERGVFVLLNKVSGRIEFIDCPYDEPFIAELEAKAAAVRDAVKSGAAPERHQTSECARCPFAHVCLPDKNFGPGVGILDSAELIAAIEKRELHREAKRAFDEADKVVKALLPERPGELLVGRWAAIGTEVKRKAYQVKEGSYVKWEIRSTNEGSKP